MNQTTNAISRQRILDIARRLLVREGITRVSMRMIARDVGCSVGSIYFYFKDKDELVHSLIDEGFQRLLHEQEIALSGKIHPRDCVQAFCENYIRFGLANPEYYEIMFMLKPERMARYPAANYRRARRALEAIAESLQANGDDSEAAFARASRLWSYLHGVVALLLAKRIDQRLDRDTFIAEASAELARLYTG